MQKRTILLTELILLFCICYFPLCYRIDALPVNQWDEARNAVNTVEMLQNHQYLVRYYAGEPETWETKPPLLIWLQVLSTRIFGINELALRFPVMMATFLTAALLVFYFYKYFQNRYIGYIASFVLVTTDGYIDRHIARTGDHDALLILFLTAIVLFFARYLFSEKIRPIHVLGIALLFILAVYTKSIAAFFVLPGLLLSAFIFGATRKLLLDKWFYLSIFSVILTVGAYYTAREILQPGYLNIVWHEELFPRFANTENRFNSETFWFYAQNLFNTRFKFWIWIFLPGCILLPFQLKGKMRQLYLYLIINVVVIFTIISLGTKNLWYDGILMPFLAIVTALFIYTLWENVQRHIRRKWITSSILLAFFATMVVPYSAIIKKVSRSSLNPWDIEIYSISNVIRNESSLNRLPDPVKIVYETYNAHLLFYVEAINYTKKKDRLNLNNIQNAGLVPGDAVIISQQQVMDSISQNYNYRILNIMEPVKVLEILEEKQ